MCRVLFAVGCSVVNEMLCLYLLLFPSLVITGGGGNIDQSFQKALNESCKTAIET